MTNKNITVIGSNQVDFYGSIVPRYWSGVDAQDLPGGRAEIDYALIAETAVELQTTDRFELTNFLTDAAIEWRDEEPLICGQLASDAMAASNFLSEDILGAVLDAAAEDEEETVGSFGYRQEACSHCGETVHIVSVPSSHCFYNAETQSYEIILDDTEIGVLHQTVREFLF